MTDFLRVLEDKHKYTTKGLLIAFAHVMTNREYNYVYYEASPHNYLHQFMVVNIIRKGARVASVDYSRHALELLLEEYAGTEGLENNEEIVPVTETGVTPTLEITDAGVTSTLGVVESVSETNLNSATNNEETPFDLHELN